MADLVESIEDILRRQRGSILRGRRGTTLTGSAAQEFYERVAAVYGVGRSAIPVGTPISLADVAQPAVTGLSQVVSGSTGISTGSVFGLPGTSRRVTTAPNQTLVSNQQTTQEEAMDLGSIVTTLGSQYIQARFGQARTPTILSAAGPQYGMQVPVGMGPDTYGITPTPAFLPALPGAVGAAGSLAGKIGGAVAGLGLGLAADEIAAIAGVASKVKCRRRRRRLATHSDIKDLAALKAVLGSGKAFDTWIATRRV
jgi:hypothetical protein